MEKKLACYDCYQETLKVITILGQVHMVSEMSIATVSVCTRHKVKRLRDDIKCWERLIEGTQEEIATLIMP